MGTVLLILHIVVCLFLIPVILLQAGKGGGMGSAFGGGGSGSVFGGRGASTFLTRMTSIMATLFMVLCVLLTLVNFSDDLAAAGKKGKPGEYWEWLDKVTAVQAPAATDAPEPDAAKPAEAPKPDAAKPAAATKPDEVKPAEEPKPAEAPKPAEVKPAEEPKPAEPPK